MATLREYFLDKNILLLLSFNFFLFFLTIISVILRLVSGAEGTYISQYRSDIGIGAFKTGGLIDILSFIIFALLVLVISIILSIKAYGLRKELSIVLLTMCGFLLIATIIVSNGLLALR
jgi:uncharacterized Tic20 family protein